MARSQQLKAELLATKQAEALDGELRVAFARAEEADRAGNEHEAIALHEGAAKAAMAYVRANPAEKTRMTPILQRVIGRARELKALLAEAEMAAGSLAGLAI